MNQYLIECPNCGRHYNNDMIYCDKCKGPVVKIKLGEDWYDTDELDKDNPYNQEKYDEG